MLAKVIRQYLLTATSTGLIIILGAVFLSGSVQANTDDEQQPCLECHKGALDRLSKKNNHPPFIEKDCYACHAFHGYQNNLALAGPIIDLCSSCHTTYDELSEEHRHYPLTEEPYCVACHDPHGSDNNSLLKQPLKETCLECHDSPDEAEHPLHPPYAEATCTDCHNPHGSSFGTFFQMPLGYVCLSCHQEVLSDTDPSEMHTADENASCENCHVGHIIKEPALLKEPLEKLCLSCHSDIEDKLEKEFPHAALEENDCTMCHSPHLRQLIESQVDLCGGCHDLEDDNYTKLHNQISPTRCSGCHDPHGSDLEKLIKPNQHPPFEDRECDGCHESDQTVDDLRNPEICFTCHDEPDEIGVHKGWSEKNRTCISCHSPHASQKPGLIRSTF